VGKSTVARLLARRWGVQEVADLALATGAGRRVRGGVQVDLPRLRAGCRSAPAAQRTEVLVGHLAHLLPVREAIVLRCHPLELGRRLSRARRGTSSDREANVVSEAIDLVLDEALRTCRIVYEIDTTGRSPASVAREVDRRLRSGGPSRRRIVDWVADPAVTEHLLESAA
jgi:broad-specificity NMP kinase